MVCKKCGQQIDDKAAICAHCGAKNKNYNKSMGKKPIYKKWWFWLILVLLGFYLIGATGGEDAPEEVAHPASIQVEPTPESITEEPAEAPTEEATEETTEAATEATEPPTEEDNATMGEKNALRKAKQYLDFTAFSYEGLIDQLEYEEYTHEEAVYAADNCGADWNEQALLKALSYLDFTAFSYTGLIEQLEYEEFTTEQATYGADNCGADWYEQAANSAENYLEFSAFSREGLIDQLEYEGFTYEQAVYGVEANGY